MSARRIASIALISFILMLIASACNLGGSPEEPTLEANIITNTLPPTRTLAPAGVPTTLPVTAITFPTRSVFQPTPIVNLPPTVRFFPTSTPLPISIVILSPIPGNIVARNVQVLGSAIHPQFLQYQLEFGPDPNPGNLWYPITGSVQTPILTSQLGIWNTTTIPDGNYQLRLRVFLRDGSELATVVNVIRVQNQAPTPVPSNTPIAPRPIAAFTQDRTTGDAPLVVRFTNQSQPPANITSYSWDFGDGSTSPELNPLHTFRTPGIYNVLLTVNGPGGSSNVSRQISVQSPTAPVAAFIQDKVSGPAPLTVQFTNQSTGNITSYAWNFGDGNLSNVANPTNTFAKVGSYNVILTVIGPGGSSTVTRQITVENPQIPPPKAAFTPSMTSGNIPLTVNFTNQSTGNITSYLWDFNGDGITDSVDVNPTYIYTTGGTYTARLIVIGAGGQNKAEATITAIKPPDAPVSDFSADKTSGDAPLTVKFTNKSSGNITAYAWDFNGDGKPDSTDPNPTHIFDTPGTYTVKLTVTGPGGSHSKELAITATVPVKPPVADFKADKTSGQAPLTVQFINQSSGDNLSYSWNFGDGGTSTDLNPLHQFATANTYTVTLTVTNSIGTSSKQMTITVTAAPVAPVASFTASPTSGNAPLLVTFTNASTGDITAYSWDFDGNGSPDSTDVNPTFTYPTAGSYNVTLTVSGPGGTSTPFTLPITVTAAPVAPIANFTAAPTSGNAPLLVTFTNASTGDITAYSWDFDGNGSPDSTDVNPTFTYPTAGNFNASLTVSGPGGTSAPFTLPIIVTAAPVAPVANFTAAPTSGNAPLLVTFTNASTGDITAYSWDFDGNGSPDSTDVNPTFTYPTAGNFNASLTVSGPGGTSTPFTLPITVNAAPVAPVASFTASPTSGNAPLLVTFTNASTGDITAYSWDFDGNGSPDSTDVNPTFTYPTAGSYNVTLTVSGPGGTSAPFTVPITVNAAPVAPIANFTAAPTSGNAPLLVTFTNASTGDITAYSWDFDGNGSPDSTDVNPTFTYPTAGSYNVTLTVSGPGGTSTPFTLPITVTAAPVAPIANFTAAPTSGNAPLLVTFTNASTGDITAYSWDFDGNGSPDSTDVNPTFTYPTAGNFNAALTVSGPGGTSAPFTLPITVTAAPVAPVASFTASPTSGNAPLLVTFTNASTGDITAYSWDFDGNGSPDSTDVNPSFTYPTAGSYNATLTVSGPGGTSAPFTVPITVNAAPVAPIANFTASPTAGNAPLLVTFTNASTGDITAYSWDFDGNGSPDSTDVNPTFTYPTAGSYNAALTVSGPGGTSAPFTLPITVTAAPVAPVASFTASPTSGNAPLLVTFTNASTGDITAYSWDFDGNGSPDSTDVNPTFTYPTAGSYNAALTVSGPGGTSAPFTLPITVTAAPVAPIANFTAVPTSGNAPLLVTFTNASTGDITAYSWDFDGNGSPDSTDVNPTFTYPTAGNFNASLTVSGPGGTSTPFTLPITVNAAPVAPTTKRILFVSNRSGNNEIYMMADDGSNPVNLTNNGADDITPAWSPDGKKIVFASNRNGSYDIFILNDDGSGVTPLTSGAGNNTSPAWSPDGAKIVFVSDRNGAKDIFVMNASDGSGVTPLTAGAGNNTSPAWSPDGAKIVFVSDRNGAKDIFVMNASDGSGVTPLTAGAGNNTSPAWSPDGTRIAFNTDRDSGNQEIYVMNADGSAPTNLTASPGVDDQPAWSADNAQIVFHTDRDGNLEIYAMNAVDGSSQQRLTNDGAADINPRWQPN